MLLLDFRKEELYIYIYIYGCVKVKKMICGSRNTCMDKDTVMNPVIDTVIDTVMNPVIDIVMSTVINPVIDTVMSTVINTVMSTMFNSY